MLLIETRLRICPDLPLVSFCLQSLLRNATSVQLVRQPKMFSWAQNNNSNSFLRYNNGKGVEGDAALKKSFFLSASLNTGGCKKNCAPIKKTAVQGKRGNYSFYTLPLFFQTKSVCKIHNRTTEQKCYPAANRSVLHQSWCCILYCTVSRLPDCHCTFYSTVPHHHHASSFHFAKPTFCEESASYKSVHFSLIWCNIVHK